MRGAQRQAVTLVVYGWQDSEPGTLAWVFPSLRAALRAVRALRNAMGWLIVRGKRAVEGDVDVAALRRRGMQRAPDGPISHLSTDLTDRSATLSLS
jgi:hypothetical protein